MSDRKFTMTITSNGKGKFTFAVHDEVRGFKSKSSNHDYVSAINYGAAMNHTFIDQETRDAQLLREEARRGRKVLARPAKEKAK